MAAQTGSKKVIYAALFGNLLIAITKFIAAFITGSSAMLSEGVHSVVDTGNEILLLYGMHRANRPPDETHPLGYARELYFWSFIVALLIFAVGAAVSFYEGIRHLRHPDPIQHVVANFAVLGLSAVFEGVTWWIALKKFNQEKGDLGYLAAARSSKDPRTFTVLFEDTAALLGLFIAFISIAAAELLELPQLDGVGSIGIGCVLAATAVFLARESKGLLIGERALPSVRRDIAKIVNADPDVEAENSILTVQLGPNEIVVAIDVTLKATLAAREIENCLDRIEAGIREQLPDVKSAFLRPRFTAAGD